MTAGILIDISNQTLTFSDESGSIVYPISSAKNGVGQLENTGCTPLGKHRIAQKIGDNAPINSVFVGRVATGEIYTETLSIQNPDRDWILTRILWLDGLEDGINRGYNEQGVCDSFRRYIYIHGTPDSEPMGVPLSHGCIRMRNDDVVELFEKVAIGTPVEIVG